MPEKAQMRSKRPSIKDVAKSAGVSTATVSYVFSGKKHVNRDLVDRVRSVADQMGYQVDRVASQLRAGRANVVAVIVPDLEDLFLSRLVSRLEACAQDSGFELIVSTSGKDTKKEETRIRSLLAWRPAGIIVVPYRDALSSELNDELADTPCVMADRVNQSLAQFDTVTVDNFRSGLVAADYLRKKKVGSLLAICAARELHTMQERIRGIEDVCSKSGSLSFDVLEVSPDPVEAAAAIHDHLRKGKIPEAVVGLSNVTTLAALAAFSELNIEVPKDLMLVGYHDSLWMTARKNPITTLAQPVDSVAQCAWDTLADRMKGDASPPRHVVFSAELIERASTERRSG